MARPTIEHDEAGGRFVAEVEGGTAELAYFERDGALDLVHTYVPEEARQKGVAAALVEHALAHARAEGVRVIASCPYVRAWVARHPDEAGDVVAPPGE